MVGYVNEGLGVCEGMDFGTSHVNGDGLSDVCIYHFFGEIIRLDGIFEADHEFVLGDEVKVFGNLVRGWEGDVNVLGILSCGIHGFVLGEQTKERVSGFKRAVGHDEAAKLGVSFVGPRMVETRPMSVMIKIEDAKKPRNDEWIVGGFIGDKIDIESGRVFAVRFA